MSKPCQVTVQRMGDDVIHRVSICGFCLQIHGAIGKRNLCTDGVPEATDGNNELYGSGRLYHILNENTEAAPEMVLRAVKADVDRFVGDAPQFDDLTMLCLEYHG